MTINPKNEDIIYTYISYIIYADLEPLSKKIDVCKNNPKKPSTPKIGKHVPYWNSMSSIWTFNHIDNKLHMKYISWGRLYEKVL